MRVGDRAYINDGTLTFEVMVVDDGFDTDWISVSLSSKIRPVRFERRQVEDDRPCKSQNGVFTWGILPGSMVYFYNGRPPSYQLPEGSKVIPPDKGLGV